MDTKRIAAMCREIARMFDALGDAFESKPPGPRTRRRKRVDLSGFTEEQLERGRQVLERLGKF